MLKTDVARPSQFSRWMFGTRWGTGYISRTSSRRMACVRSGFDAGAKRGKLMSPTHQTTFEIGQAQRLQSVLPAAANVPIQEKR